MQDRESNGDGNHAAGSHLYAYTVEEFENAEGKTARSWTRIGVAFPHKDGTGFNIQLRALPLDGHIVLFPAGDDARAERREDAPQAQTDLAPPRRNDSGPRPGGARRSR